MRVGGDGGGDFGRSSEKNSSSWQISNLIFIQVAVTLVAEILEVEVSELSFPKWSVTMESGCIINVPQIRSDFLPALSLYMRMIHQGLHA